jgi:hypothetical protein
MNSRGSPRARRLAHRAKVVAFAALAAVSAACQRRSMPSARGDSGAHVQRAARDAGWAAASSIFVGALEAHRSSISERTAAQQSWGIREVDAMLAALSEPAVALELATLDPDVRPSDGGPQAASGHARRSSVRVTDTASREALARALIDAVAQANAMDSMCFEAPERSNRLTPCFHPRHAVTFAVAGRTVSWIICVDCVKMQVWVDGEFVTAVSIDGPTLANRLPPSEPPSAPPAAVAAP